MQISDKMFGRVGKKSYLCTRNSEMIDYIAVWSSW